MDWVFLWGQSPSFSLCWPRSSHHLSLSSIDIQVRVVLQLQNLTKVHVRKNGVLECVSSLLNRHTNVSISLWLSTTLPLYLLISLPILSISDNYCWNKTSGKWMRCDLRAIQQSNPNPSLSLSLCHPPSPAPSSCAPNRPLNHSAQALWLVDLSAWLNSHFHHVLHRSVTEWVRGSKGGRQTHWWSRWAGTTKWHLSTLMMTFGSEEKETETSPDVNITCKFSAHSVSATEHTTTSATEDRGSAGRSYLNTISQ